MSYFDNTMPFSDALRITTCFDEPTWDDYDVRMWVTHDNGVTAAFGQGTSPTLSFVDYIEQAEGYLQMLEKRSYDDGQSDPTLVKMLDGARKKLRIIFGWET